MKTGTDDKPRHQTTVFRLKEFVRLEKKWLKYIENHLADKSMHKYYGSKEVIVKEIEQTKTAIDHFTKEIERLENENVT